MVTSIAACLHVEPHAVRSIVESMVDFDEDRSASADDEPSDEGGDVGETEV